MIINSILDNDLYKFTMQNAIIKKFPNSKVNYQFINRGKHKFTQEMVNQIKSSINNMKYIYLSDREYLYLKNNLNYLCPTYIDFLKEYKFDPNEVNVLFKNGLHIEISGYWYRTILWEVPIMAIISEVYNLYKNKNIYHAHNYYSLNSKIYINSINNIQKFDNYDIKFSDFGTRRRFSKKRHENIIKYCKLIKSFIGTSNLQLAYENNLKPIGTQAHEWFMFHGAKYGYPIANVKALENWLDIYNNKLDIALSDTYTTDIFFKDFNLELSNKFSGTRHDSGNSFTYIEKCIKHYENLGIDPKTKTIIFSDGINNISDILEIKNYCKNKINCSFGIGTWLSNNVYDMNTNFIKPINIVIKMNKADTKNVVKLSDNSAKNTGNLKEIELCKTILKIN